MRFGRKDYDDRIAAADSLIPDDEPVFLVRGSDVLAPHVLAHYYSACSLVGAPEDVKLSVAMQLKAVAEWQATHPPKVADLPTS